MATIIENLKKILEARYRKDVRQAIHDSIENCYNDGKAGSIDLQARQMLGDTNISSIADGTVTGSVKTLSDEATENEAAISEVNSKLGNTDISAIGDGTVTGGLDALNSNLSELGVVANSKASREFDITTSQNASVIVLYHIAGLYNLFMAIYVHIALSDIIGNL